MDEQGKNLQDLKCQGAPVSSELARCALAEGQAMSKVLVIDDSDSWYSAIESQLAKHGYTALRARHHDEAVATAMDQQPTLVVIDLLLAAKGGASFVRKLRSVPGLKNAPMVLTSSGTGHSAVRHALGPHAQDIVPKNATGLDSITQRLQKLPMSA